MAKQAKKSTKLNPRTVSVKSSGDVIGALDRLVEQTFYKRLGRGFSVSTQTKIVAYGPWLMAGIHLMLLPALLVLAKEGQFITFSQFISGIFFNQSSWILMLIVIANSLLLAAGLSDVFEKKRRGWNCIYTALLVSGAYVLIQLIQNPLQFAAPLMSFAAISILLFSVLDVRKYYK